MLAFDNALLTPDEMGLADKAAVVGGVSEIALMEAAGRAVAEAVAARWSRRPVTVLCGPGNNGGDGFVAARHLAMEGWPVRLALLGERDRLAGAAAHHAARYRGAVEPLSPDVIAGSGVVIDSMFGAGLSRPIDGIAHAVIAALGASRIPVAAVDVPSGVDGATGAIRGAAPRADLTVTFFRKKPGHLLYPGRGLCGTTRLAQIGIPDNVLGDIAPRCFENGPPLWLGLYPWPQAEDHKYRRGHVVVFGGTELTGAARLAARAAARGGAGLVTVAAPEAAWPIYASALMGIIVRPMRTPEDFVALIGDERVRAMVVGPGAGVTPETRAAALAALGTRRAVVLDADALTAFAQSTETLIAAIKGPTVLTPHEGEFARLFDGEGDRLSRARQAAKLAGAVIVLKGADTVIAAPDGRAAINANAPPDLATGGTGDVLAGLIAGLLAQGVAPFEAASAGCWLHGEAAREFGPGLVADDLIDTLPPALRRLKALASSFGMLKDFMTDRSSFLDGVYDFTLTNLRTLKARWRDFAGEKAVISALLSDSDADRLRRQMQDCLEARGGEVSARARAAALGQTYLAAPEEGRARFLRLLADEFDIDHVAVASACQRIAHARSEDERRRIERALRQALEPPRVKLLTQFNALPNGVKFLVDMRAELMNLARHDESLAALDHDLRALLTGWFDEGFLEVKRITWDSPAALLEKLMVYEAVHEIRSWSDLKNRLEADRRCFAYFHPRMPDEPLIFVEVALVQGMADNIQSLLDETAPVGDPQTADTATFYSISNCQRGLSGISFGDFLIKRVADRLNAELPHLTRYATLSPMPGFGTWLDLRSAEEGEDLLTAAERKAIEALPSAPTDHLLTNLLARPDWYEDPDVAQAVKAPLLRLAARYLINEKTPRGRALDGVAHFHLSNGARLERINWLGDLSSKGLQQSAGLMINYLYRLEDIEENHEAYTGEGRVTASQPVLRLLKA